MPPYSFIWDFGDNTPLLNTNDYMVTHDYILDGLGSDSLDYVFDICLIDNDDFQSPPEPRTPPDLLARRPRRYYFVVIYPKGARTTSSRLKSLSVTPQIAPLKCPENDLSRLLNY